jgi:hypothetical protein
MEINYYVLGSVLIVIVVFLWFFFKRNKKDKRSMEKTIMASDTEPEKHPEDQI